jgi:hypothetical protein
MYDPPQEVRNRDALLDPPCRDISIIGNNSAAHKKKFCGSMYIPGNVV